MTNPWTQRWDERYSQTEFAYGTEPNHFFREQLNQFKPGNILCAAEGEGRNAVYAATKGWQASAFDISQEGCKKAMQLAAANNVVIDYRVGELDQLGFKPESFEALALIYAHFPANIKSDLHKKLIKLLKPGATVIFEAFSKKHLEYIAKNEQVGGPRELDMLFSFEEIQADFAGFEILELTETEVQLNEGLFHNGLGSVVRFVGRKS